MYVKQSPCKKWKRFSFYKARKAPNSVRSISDFGKKQILGKTIGPDQVEQSVENWAFSIASAMMILIIISQKLTHALVAVLVKTPRRKRSGESAPRRIIDENRNYGLTKSDLWKKAHNFFHTNLTRPPETPPERWDPRAPAPIKMAEPLAPIVAIFMDFPSAKISDSS